MRKEPSGIHKALMAGVALATFLTNTSLAQTADWKGYWKAGNGKSEVRFLMSEKGNSWYGTSVSKTPLKLVLNPAGLQNVWMGTLEWNGKHDVKAEYKDGVIKLTDLKDKSTWVLKPDR